jgi:hypothetical protein
MRHKIYKIAWQDAYGITGYFYTKREINKLSEEYIVNTVGYKVRETEKGIFMAGERDGKGKYRDITYIPKILIINIIEERMN